MKRTKHLYKDWIVRLTIATLIMIVNLGAVPADIRIQVKVTDCTTGYPIRNAAVRVPTSEIRVEKQIAYTGANGIATIYPVKPGDMNHRVEVSAYGYEMKSVTRFMSADTYVDLKVCLDPLTTPTLAPTKTVMPSVTLMPTVDVVQISSNCSSYITQKIELVLPQVSETENQGKLAQIREKASTAAIQCNQELSCVLKGSFAELAAFTTELMLRQGIPFDRALELMGALLDPAGEVQCTELGQFVMELSKDLAIGGLDLGAFALHGSAVVLIADEQGQQSGFDRNGNKLENIPQAQAWLLGETQYVVVPASSVKKITVQGSSEGQVTLEIVLRLGGFVLEASFDQVPVNMQTEAEVILNGIMPELVLQPTGNEEAQRRQPSGLKVFEVVPTNTPITPMETTQATTALLPEATATAQSPSKPFTLPCACPGTISAPLLGAVLWLKRKYRQSQ